LIERKGIFGFNEGRRGERYLDDGYEKFVGGLVRGVGEVFWGAKDG